MHLHLYLDVYMLSTRPLIDPLHAVVHVCAFDGPLLAFCFYAQFPVASLGQYIGISLQLKAICLCASVEAWCAVSFHPGASVSVFFPSHTLSPSVCCLLLLGRVIPTFCQHPPDVSCSLTSCPPRLVTMAMASA